MPYSCEFLAEIKTLVKAQLKHLGAFVDEELPDYIMVMVANKKKRESMNNDLQLFLGSQTEKFTEWLHTLLETHGSNNSDSKPIANTDSSAEKKKKVIKTVEKKISRRFSRSSREHRSRSRSPLIRRDSISSSSFANADADIISVRADENEFVEESKSLFALDSTSSNTSSNKQKEQRRIVSTSSLPGKSDNQLEHQVPGLRSLVKVSTHQPSSTTAAPHMRPVGLLLKRAMNEAQASLKSPPAIVSPTLLGNSNRPAAVVRGRKRPAEEPLQSSNSGDEEDIPKAKSTRFVVTLNESANLANTPTAISNVKSRLGPRVAAPPDYRQKSPFLSIGDDVSHGSIDVRDILIAKKLKKSQKLISDEEPFQQRIKKKLSAEQLKKILPMIINLNDTDEDEALVSNDNMQTVMSPEPKSSAVVPPPKRENIPSTLERCKYWPSCRNGTTCQFIHPKEECKAFPNCRYGEKCLYLHPACKFGALCSRIGCAFSHAGQLPHQAPQVTGVITCRFAPNCKNASCPFNHPSGPVAVSVASAVVAKTCRFGSACGSKKTCPFSHPKGSAMKTRMPASHQLKWIAPGKSNISEAVSETTVS